MWAVANVRVDDVVGMLVAMGRAYEADGRYRG